jgi:hypothetical protein
MQVGFAEGLSIAWARAMTSDAEKRFISFQNAMRARSAHALEMQAMPRKDVSRCLLAALSRGLFASVSVSSLPECNPSFGLRISPMIMILISTGKDRIDMV